MKNKKIQTSFVSLEAPKEMILFGFNYENNLAVKTISIGEYLIFYMKDMQLEVCFCLESFSLQLPSNFYLFLISFTYQLYFLVNFSIKHKKKFV